MYFNEGFINRNVSLNWISKIGSEKKVWQIKLYQIEKLRKDVKV